MELTIYRRYEVKGANMPIYIIHANIQRIEERMEVIETSKATLFIIFLVIIVLIYNISSIFVGEIKRR